MIFCHDKVYMKVWKLQSKNEKYMDIQGTTSEKDKDGNYINSSWYPRLIGAAFQTMKNTLKEGDRIVITKCKLSNEKYTAKDGTVKSAFRFLILEAEPEGAPAAKPAEPKATQEPAVQPASDDDLPW